MNGIFISDLHLTDRRDDDYRWEVFEQVAEVANERGISDLYILGDLTEFKDYHSSRLVNRIVQSFYQLRKASRITMIHILKGNHDGLDPDRPYFLFLKRIPWIRFYSEPTRCDVGKDTLLFLPHTRTPEEDWRDIEFDADYIFFHGTLTGSVSESGQRLEGIPSDLFAGLRATIIGGDIHVPQTVGAAIYVGAPYPIRFGDSFAGRLLVAREGCPLDAVELRNIRKLTLTLDQWPPTTLDCPEKGDQVKFRIVLAPSEFGLWQERKRWAEKFCADAGAKLRKVELVKKETKFKIKTPTLLMTTPGGPSWIKAQFDHYCQTANIEPALRNVGSALMED